MPFVINATLVTYRDILQCAKRDGGQRRWISLFLCADRRWYAVAAKLGFIRGTEARQQIVAGGPLYGLIGHAARLSFLDHAAVTG